MKRLLILPFLVLAGFLLTGANVPALNTHNLTHNSKISKKRYAILKQALELPLNRRNQFFQKRPHYFSDIRHIFQSKKSLPSLKWHALMTMTRLNPQKARIYIDQALDSSDWFLKNAGLIALEIIQPETATKKAAEFLDHPALMLRTASVELIRRRKAREYKDILWTQLGAAQNFKNGKSLWVRYTIAQTLSEFSEAKDKDLFLALMEDADPRINSIALRTLQRIEPFEKKNTPSYQQRLAREKTRKKTL